MAKLGNNYGEGEKLCVLCQSHTDSQEESFLCNEIMNAMNINESYKEINSSNSSKELVKLLKQIMKIREDRTQ